MIDKKEIEAFVEEGLTGSDCFVVDVQVKPDNVIVVEIDNEEGVDIDRCVALHRFLESKLDRDVEDYELEVGSAGITSPFKVLGQYKKNIGKEVELLTKNGMKLSGILKSADSEKFVVTITKKVKSETSKRKVEVEEDLAFEYSSVQATIHSPVHSVKNPRTGSITAESFGAIILDENIKAPGNCELKLWDDQTCFD